jgi:hypothetical protein
LTQTSTATLRQPTPGSSARHSSCSAAPPASPVTRHADTTDLLVKDIQLV